MSRGGSPEGDLSWPLQRAARHYGETAAVSEEGRTLTYRELRRRVEALGGALDELDLAPGDRVGFLGANSLTHLECWLGVPAFGRVLVDLNFRLAPAELAFMVDDCGLEVLFTGPDQLEVALELKQRCSALREIVVDGSGPLPEGCHRYERLLESRPAEAPSLAPDTLAAISYTGGTTGLPKGVMLSHGNLLSNARHNLIATGHRPRNRWLHVCPMFHVAGTANVFACTWVGARQFVLPRFSAPAVLEAVEREGITHTVLVPTMLAMLLDDPAFATADLSSLEHVQYAASPISPELQRRVLEQLPCEVAQFYGMTEAAPTVTCCTEEDHRRGHAGEEPHRTRLRSMGAPVVGVQAEIRDPGGRALPQDEIGEVWVRGPNVMLGYWQRPRDTAAVLHEGWYRTGDAGYCDADGYLYLVDRLKDMIISGGENVYSIEVETALAEHEAVLEAAVFGVPDARWGEAVHAVVVVRSGAAVDADTLIEHCRARIAGYKLPRTIELRTEPLPKSGAGKVLKQQLREPFWAGHDRRVS